MSTVNRLIISTILLFWYDQCLAADSTYHKYPQAVLVQLRTEQNRLKALAADKQYQKMEEVRTDAAGANAAMISDFRDHFSYCPVYFFADTEQDQILAKHFEGIIKDTASKTVRKPISALASNHYVIIYYGYPDNEPGNEKGAGDSYAVEHSSGEPAGKGLIICNSRMAQVSHIDKFGYSELGMRKSLKKYAYFSKHFDIEYFPLAENLDKKLKKQAEKKKN